MSDNNFSFNELRSLIREGLEEKFPVRLAEEDKPLPSAAGEETIKLRVPEFTLDMSWVSDAAEATNPESYERFKKVVAATGLGGNISKIKKFITDINKFTSTVVPAENHGEAISRILVLRTLYNLAKSDNPQTMGFLFERFMALMFGGTVVQPDELGLVDVEFTNSNVSLKFIRSGGEIGGSLKKLKQDLFAATPEEEKREKKRDKERRPAAPVKYIVCTKPGDEGNEVTFHEFIITSDSYERLPLNAKETRFSGKLTEFEDVRPIGAIDLSNVIKSSQDMMELLNKKFKGLILEVQQLTREVDSLMLGVGGKETKERAGAAKGRAEKSRQAAADIEKTA
jgi:hypothetical protein